MKNFRETLDVTKNVKKALILSGDEITEQDVEELGLMLCRRYYADPEVPVRARELMQDALVKEDARVRSLSFRELLAESISPKAALTNFPPSRFTTLDATALSVRICRNYADDPRIPISVREILARRIQNHEEAEARCSAAFERICAEGPNEVDTEESIRDAIYVADDRAKMCRLYGMTLKSSWNLLIVHELMKLLGNWHDQKAIYKISAPGSKLEAAAESAYIGWIDGLKQVDQYEIHDLARVYSLSRPSSQLRFRVFLKLMSVNTAEARIWYFVLRTIKNAGEFSDAHHKQLVEFAAESLLKCKPVYRDELQEGVAAVGYNNRVLRTKLREAMKEARP